MRVNIKPGENNDRNNSKVFSDVSTIIEGGKLEATDFIVAEGVRNGKKITTRFGIRSGYYDMNGATLINGGVNFTVYSSGATEVSLLLFDRGMKEPYAKIDFPIKYRIGDVYSIIVIGLDIEAFEYAYSIDGPWDPQKGLLFDKRHYLLDPYAKAVTGQSVWGVQSQSDAIARARVVRNNYDWGKAQQPVIPIEDTIIYELHVRGFTKSDTSGVSCKGTFAGILQKLSYLKKLGITAVELLPIFEFNEMAGYRKVDGRELCDYWGYNTVSFFAPNTSYTYEKEYNREGTELKELIKILNKEGIEVYLDVVFNHTAEGNEKGPFISFKGFDNNVYYLLSPDGKYYNFSGCGNTMNCNHPVVQQMIVDCLRYWVTSYRVDGFRFDLASILGRNEDGSPMANPPLIEKLAFDPILKDCKLIAEAWDAAGMYQVGSFPAWKRWAEWNGKYRDCIRDYLKGDYWHAPEALTRISGSLDLYSNSYDGSRSSVNFITCHDGFTLYDLFSYNCKHNESNGYNNTDGTDDNHSWNCGIEGDTDDAGVLSLRFKLMRNACTILMLSRGTPMILAGDEFGRTKKGNNNTFCQDNELSWLDWSLLEKNKDYYDFYKSMIWFRKKHLSISRDMKPSITGYPFISHHSSDPEKNTICAEDKAVGVLYAGNDGSAEDIVYLAMNVHWEKNNIKLPWLPDGFSWGLAVDTADVKKEYYKNEPDILNERDFLMSERSIAVFVAIKQ